MVSQLFLGLALIGSEWVLYILLLLSALSVAVIIERIRFYKEASKNINTFSRDIRYQIENEDFDAAIKTILIHQTISKQSDFGANLVNAILQAKEKNKSLESLSELANDAILRTKIQWEKNLSLLATIGNNAPFIGLFGTVLGIIQAFHNLSLASGMQGVMSGLSEALIATAVGIFVALPAVAAFNSFQRRVKSAANEAQALKSFVIGHIYKTGPTHG